MRVLHVLNELRYSGAEVMLRCAKDVFDQNGIESHILATSKNEGAYSKELRKAGYIIHHLPLKKNISSIFKFARFLVKSDFDIIHIHPERLSFMYGVISRLTAHKTIRTVHHIFYFEGVLKWYKYLQRKLVNLIGVVSISNSQSGKQNEFKRFSSDNPIIPNWYDEDYFKPNFNKNKYRRELGLPIDKKYLVTVGSNSEYKNYELVLDTLERLNENYIYIHVGNQGQLNPLTKIARQKKISKQFISPGKVDDIRPYLYAADVYLMPSTVEGFGVAAVEAMACGLPVILSNKPALKDFKELENEIILTELNPKDLERNIIELFEKDLERIGQKLSTFVEDRFSADQVVPKYVELYHQCLEK